MSSTEANPNKVINIGIKCSSRKPIRENPFNISPVIIPNKKEPMALFKPCSKPGMDNHPLLHLDVTMLSNLLPLLLPVFT